jgi:hypothetical protein
VDAAAAIPRAAAGDAAAAAPEPGSSPAAAAAAARQAWRAGLCDIRAFCLAAGRAGIPLPSIARELLDDGARFEARLGEIRDRAAGGHDDLCALALVAAGRIQPTSLDQHAVITEAVRWLGSAAAARAGVRRPWADAVPTVAEVLALFRDAAGRHQAKPASIRPPSPPPLGHGTRLVSAMGGLALLHPWLPRAMRDAVAALAPRDAEEVIRVRGELLMLACPPGPPGSPLPDDPLLRLLAGLDPRGTGWPPAGCDPAASAERLALPAHRLLRSFADAVPGLKAHGDELIRDHFMRRTALLRDRGTAWDVLMGRNQLDVLMAASPIPLGMVKLPWAPLLELGFDGDGAGPAMAGR